MRLIVAVFLLFISTTAMAQQNQRAPVNVATRLYKDCLAVKLSGRLQIEPTRVGIAAFVEELDDNCLAWTVIWYQALMGHSMIQIPFDVMGRFTANRLALLQTVSDNIKVEALR